MYRVFLYVGQVIYGAASSSNVTEFDSVANAKKVAAEFVTRNKTLFQNGYTAIVINMDTLKVVSTVRVELPSLSWTDVQ